MLDERPGARQSIGYLFLQEKQLYADTNVVLSLCLAFVIDYVKDNYPFYELTTYSVMFIVAALLALSAHLCCLKCPSHNPGLPGRIFSSCLNVL